MATTSPCLRASRSIRLLALVLALTLLQPNIGRAQEPGSPQAVGFPGDYAPAIGGQAWAPDDPAVQAADEDQDGVWTLTVELPAGRYAFKAALDGSWAENYGLDGQGDGPNVHLEVPEPGGLVTFLYDQASHRVWAQVRPLEDPASPPRPGDGEIRRGDVLHDSRQDLYRTPFGAVPFRTQVTLRLRTAAQDVEEVALLVAGTSSGARTTLPMRKVATDPHQGPFGYDYWEAVLDSGPRPEVHRYIFRLTDGETVVYYADGSRRDGGPGSLFPVQPPPDQGWDIYTYDPDFSVPTWAQEAIIYQIFPDRFRNGDPSNDPTQEDWFYPDERGHAFPVRPWNRPVPDPEPNDPAANPEWYGTYSATFYGGDLQGILEKLDYLQALGVTAIYLNPIFESPSNHRYDGRDYRQIDDNLAVKGDPEASRALFQALAQEVASRGMRLILDGVPNHVSSDAPIFDRFQRHPELGACESEESPWRDWFLFTPAVPPGSGVCAGDVNYSAWAGFDTLPQLDTANEEVVANWLDPETGIAVSYLRIPGVGGWRVDVVPDVVALNPRFFERWRQATRAANPDAVSYAETWTENDVRERILGDEFDSTMNYRFRRAVLGFLRETDFQDNDGTIPALSPSEFEAALRAIQEDYPEPAWRAAMNLLGSHDTNRAVRVLDHDGVDLRRGEPVNGFADGRRRLRLAAVLQFTLPGVPTVYYGDEVGLVGFGSDPDRDDPYNRQPYPWPDQEGYQDLPAWRQRHEDLLALYRFLGRLRRDHSFLRTGSWDTFLADDRTGLYAFGRKDATGAALVVVNSSTTTQTVRLDLQGYLPLDARLVDPVSGLTATLPIRGPIGPLDFRIWLTEPGVDLSTPQAPRLATVEEGPGTVTLTAAVDARTRQVVVQRSLVEGGYRPVATIALEPGQDTMVFVDRELRNGQPLYYRLVAVDGRGMPSPPSPPIQAIPHRKVVEARLLEPLELTHTLSAITPTQPLRAVVVVEGAAQAEGPGPGIQVELGYALVAPDQVLDPAAIRWIPAEYAGEAAGGDLYTARFTPDQAGDYIFGFRVSATGGRDWLYVDREGPGPGPLWWSPGRLRVEPSGDTDPPHRPFRLFPVYVAADQVVIGWRSSRTPDLYGYEICRRDVTLGQEGCATRIAVPREVREYTDTDVVRDHTYAYWVHAVDTSYNRSAPSRVLTVTAQVRFVEVTWRVRVPAFTPAEDTVFIAGDEREVFGGAWNPARAPMTRVDDGLWEWMATVEEGTELQYKYTRGNWETVEQWGTIRGFANRSVTIQAGPEGRQWVVDETATDWGAEGPDDHRAIQNWRDPLVVAVETTSEGIRVRFNNPVRPLGDVDQVIQVTGPGGQALAGTVTQVGDSTFVFAPAEPPAPGRYQVTVFHVTTDVPMQRPYVATVEW